MWGQLVLRTCCPEGAKQLSPLLSLGLPLPGSIQWEASALGDLQAWGRKESQAFTVPENTRCALEGLVGEANPCPIPVQPYSS